ncbi:HD-GYP domain-containing protein [Pseudoalteromonas denitrificans]|uniref:HD-GYP domain, c-di-GMP phosphodiesterase class II (Or its inactivated variant) n=1 Tax=Pseudoalteromonas denitrificans DSM 6059 TaxID=1123010 RepID=A0A1I1E6A2_9GAMM|nr:HD domain-containing phosphohydrolase [Pseudoalteromonas denitrificans]SFB82172.1 HD-GYP domain, c-di-GMP phosphodiesterase class II (or its inactivated variant) [Pseudoalteromonas denitrificans DSM 6059]
MLKTYSISDLRPGMFVKNVSKQKKKLKIKTHGWVRSQNLIEQLKKEGILEVVVDLAQKDPTIVSQKQETIVEKKLQESASKNIESTEKIKKTKKQILDDISLEQEFSKACITYDQSLNKVRTVHQDIASGMKVDIKILQKVATEIIDSVFRNEDAMAVLTRLRDKNAYAWRHTINSAILISVFARYLNYSKKSAHELTLGALLHDLGQARVPLGIINKLSSLSELENKAMQKHVAHGFNLSKTQKGVTPVMLDMIVNHHERLDGSGYPRGITGEKLSKAARMMAIVDAYDAMTADRVFKQGLEPISVLRHLLGQKEKYDSVLVQKFIKCMGVHPVGSIVKLTTDRLAIVLAGNRHDPIRPKVKVFYNAKHKHYITSKDIHLSEQDSTLKIISGVRPQDHQINLSRLLKEQLIA